MRIRDWYFQGWERRKDKNGKTRFVYTGETYVFPGGIKTVRSKACVMTATAVVLYLAAAFFPPAGGMWRIAAFSQLLEIIPLVYLVMGAVCLLRVKEPLTFRDVYASWRRMERASLVSGVIASAMAATEIAFLILYGVNGSLFREFLFTAEAAGCAAVSFVLYAYIRKHPCNAEAPKQEIR